MGLDRLRDGARVVASGAGSSAACLRELASGLQVLASGAALVGVPEIAGAAAAAARLAAEIQAGHVDAAGGPGAALAEAVDRLSDAVLFLSRPDRSGARLEGSPLPALQGRLEILVPVRRSVVPAEPSPPSGSAEDDTAWVPQVDEDMIDPFIDECTERLDGLATKLLALEESPGDGALVNEIFRDLHTVKGSSGFVGLRRMNRLAHAAEDLVGKLRQGTATAERPVVDALLGALDGLRAILERAVRRTPIDVPIDDLVARLRAPTAAGRAPAAATGEDRPARAPTASGPEGGAASGGGGGGAAGKALRVDFSKLDLLMNLVGELVLGKARVHSGLQNLEGLAREIESQRRSARRAAQPGTTGDRRGDSARPRGRARTRQARLRGARPRARGRGDPHRLRLGRAPGPGHEAPDGPDSVASSRSTGGPSASSRWASARRCSSRSRAPRRSSTRCSSKSWTSR